MSPVGSAVYLWAMPFHAHPPISSGFQQALTLRPTHCPVLCLFPWGIRPLPLSAPGDLRVLPCQGSWACSVSLEHQEPDSSCLECEHASG